MAGHGVSQADARGAGSTWAGCWQGRGRTQPGAAGVRPGLRDTPELTGGLPSAPRSAPRSGPRSQAGAQGPRRARRLEGTRHRLRLLLHIAEPPRSFWAVTSLPPVTDPPASPSSRSRFPAATWARTTFP